MSPTEGALIASIWEKSSGHTQATGGKRKGRKMLDGGLKGGKDQRCSPMGARLRVRRGGGRSLQRSGWPQQRKRAAEKARRKNGWVGGRGTRAQGHGALHQRAEGMGSLEVTTVEALDQRGYKEGR